MIQKYVTSVLTSSSQQTLVDDESRVAYRGSGGSPEPRVTFFSIPKPFAGRAAITQRNAIRSWARLNPAADLILFGQNDPLLDSLAREVGASVIPLSVNEHGTPILSGAFDFVHEHCHSQLFCYVNCDIMFDHQVMSAARELLDSPLNSFLAIGQRTTWNAPAELTADELQNLSSLFRTVQNTLSADSVVCKDYFLFTPDLFHKIPDFLVGRGNWDNWMVANAKANGVPVVDLTRCVTAVHQEHDYGHVPGGRKNAYVTGDEASHNKRLANGRHLTNGSTATWQLSAESGQWNLKRKQIPILKMVQDLPKFLSLLIKLFIRKKKPVSGVVGTSPQT